MMMLQGVSMTLVLEEAIHTPDDLLRMPDGDRYELVHGKLVEREMGTKSNWLATQITGLIWAFLRGKLQGYVFNAETSYACFHDEPNHMRRPDVSFIRFGRLPGEKLPEGHCPIPPDLAVEVVSPHDAAEDVSAKVAEFQSVGVPLIWVVYPGTRRVIVHRLPSNPAGRISELTETDTIQGEDVLPGFSCSVAEFFRIPSPQT
jgi:Uma2 family endonuclease